MKITKTELKSIVKECLVEILSEGLGETLSSVQNISQKKAMSNQSSFLENDRKQQAVTSLQHTARRQSPELREAIRREAGGNKVMESILADTAASTLPNMLQNEGRSPVPGGARGGMAEQIVASVNPEELFGEDATSKWANLAFMDSPQRNK
jgi:hypothetical protein